MLAHVSCSYWNDVTVTVDGAGWASMDLALGQEGPSPTQRGLPALTPPWEKADVPYSTSANPLPCFYFLNNSNYDYLRYYLFVGLAPPYL